MWCNVPSTKYGCNVNFQNVHKYMHMYVLYSVIMHIVGLVGGVRVHTYVLTYGLYGRNRAVCDCMYVLYIEQLDTVSAHLDGLIRDVADVRDLLDESRGRLSSSTSAGMPYRVYSIHTYSTNSVHTADIRICCRLLVDCRMLTDKHPVYVVGSALKWNSTYLSSPFVLRLSQ